MSTSLEYWNTRGNAARKSFRHFLRGDIFWSKLLNLRAGTEAFLKSEINSIGIGSPQSALNILDVACGWGVSFAENENVNLYGVDIEGFPKEIAIDNGYVDAKEYTGNLEIPYPDKFFDACTIINLNAHISSDLYRKLIDQGREKLNDDGYLLIVAELNNNGLTYRFMRWLRPKNFERMVAAMDHSNFVFEDEFDDFLTANRVQICAKQTIIGNMLPFFHYTAWAINCSPYTTLKYPAFIADIFLSLADRFFTFIGLGGNGRRFIVGYLCRPKRSGSTPFAL